MDNEPEPTLEQAEAIMALWRQLTNDNRSDSDDLESLLEGINVWAKSTGLEIVWEIREE